MSVNHFFRLRCRILIVVVGLLGSGVAEAALEPQVATLESNGRTVVLEWTEDYDRTGYPPDSPHFTLTLVDAAGNQTDYPADGIRSTGKRDRTSPIFSEVMRTREAVSDEDRIEAVLFPCSG